MRVPSTERAKTTLLEDARDVRPFSSTAHCLGKLS
jgi:hypothetical protein